MKASLHCFAVMLALLAGIYQATAQGTTAFTYQGQLHDGGTNANGSYTMMFKLYDAGTVENPPRSRLVPCFETFPSAGRVILGEKNPAVPLEESVSSFHRHSHLLRMPDVGAFTLADTGKFSLDSARY
jgi:hypothetical protein